ncbi:MAG: FAD-dependent oxidoreductase [Chlamydiales bacterium]|nr:FAD-dependent oxidoreductase [Chlamydiales bacterium]
MYGNTRPFWLAEGAVEQGTPLKTDESTDVCIVGAGIAGLTCAYTLAKEGKKVILIDSGLVAGGETCRTTAHLTWVLDDRYFELVRLFGKKGARLAGESHAKSIDYIEEIIAEEKIECHFSRLSGYLFTPPEDDKDILSKEYTCLKELDIMPIEWVEKAPWSNFDTGRCLKFANQAQFHPIEYMKGLADAVVKYGGKIYTKTRAKEFKDASPCEITTSEGYKITAPQIIVATNSPINDRLIMHTKQAAYRSYVIAATIPEGVCEPGLFWDTLDAYHYVRLSPDGKSIIVGGEDHRTGERKDTQRGFEKLEQWTRERFPIKDVTYRWSGQIIEPVDGLAYTGLNPWNKNIYIHTGDSGNGITHGTIAGILLPDLILGKKNPWKELYDPSRMILKAIDEFAKENLNTACQYMDWVQPGTNEEDIKNGCGAVVRNGMHLVAVYRDTEGKLHSKSAVCPHLKGIVRWNPTEKTWDCPCHGSRFQTDGKVANGPSKGPLKNNE